MTSGQPQRSSIAAVAPALPPGALAGHLLPVLRERGMTLDRVLVSPPIWLPNQSNTVTVCWELNGPQAWWEMTWKGRPDKALAQWWADIAALVESRTRTMAGAAGDVDTLCDV